MEGRQSFERVAGCRVSLLRGGSGLWLLYLHGAGGAGRWMPFMEALAQKFVPAADLAIRHTAARPDQAQSRTFRTEGDPVVAALGRIARAAPRIMNPP